MHHSFMPACLLGLVALALSAPALAQSGEAACPAPGTQLTFSDGGRIEAVGSQAGPICRMKSLRNDHSFERLFGAFDPKAKLIQANLDKISSLAPFAVGKKVTFQNAGADVRGGDGTWFYEVIVERTEQVQTPAGTFQAFVILQDEHSPQGSTGRWQRRFWYAPQVRYVVKFEYQTVRGNPPPNYPKNWTLTGVKSPGASG